MKLIVKLMAIGMLIAIIAVPALSEENICPITGKPLDEQGMKEMMEKAMAAMMPGEHHKALEAFVGEWDITMRVWMGGPGSEPSETTGTSSVRWVLGGRFIIEELKSEMIFPDMEGGMKKVAYEGMGFTGYDNARNMYTGNWASSMDTHLYSMYGTVDPTGKTFRFFGEMDEPMLGVVGRTVKYVNRIVDENTHVFEIIDLHAGDDYKVVEISYKRR